MEDIIYKIFKDERIKYFHSSDAFKIESGETWITYKYFQGNKNKVIVILGSTEFDEVPLKVCTTPESFENLINSLIY